MPAHGTRSAGRSARRSTSSPTRRSRPPLILTGPERLAEAARRALAILRPPPELTISDWADANRRLSSEASAEPGQWRTSRAEYAYLSNDMLKANYSNSRLALLEFRRRVEAYQHAVMVWQVCRRVWARWMDTAVMAGALAIPGYERCRRDCLSCAWLPPKWDWVDPLKDARAEIEQIEAGLKSRTQALAERGYDAEQVDAEIAADRAREERLGLSFQGGGATPDPAPEAPAEGGADATAQ